ncbi:hypothetical protein TZ54_19775 (plasmid) [Clostridioides difficile]|nr:hypothetical protein [Clostridioides difficile]KJF61673.1 hypothetical protein TZ54_19775 [Clostridioides difficile]
MKSKRINRMLATTMTMAMLAIPAVTATSYAMESTGLGTEYTYIMNLNSKKSGLNHSILKQEKKYY